MIADDDYDDNGNDYNGIDETWKTTMIFNKERMHFECRRRVVSCRWAGTYILTSMNNYNNANGTKNRRKNTASEACSSMQSCFELRSSPNRVSE